jgi:CHRD domain-containing protein
MKRRFTLLVALVAASMIPVTVSRADDRDDRDDHGRRREVFRANLSGDNEIPPVHSATGASARLRATLVDDQTIQFELTYENLSANPAAAHFHFAPKGANGGVSAFFCGGDAQPACPAATSGTITGTITAANVVGPAAQGIAAGNFAALVEALRKGLVYANMHSANFPAGEIRGQARREGRDDD